MLAHTLRPGPIRGREDAPESAPVPLRPQGLTNLRESETKNRLPAPVSNFVTLILFSNEYWDAPARPLQNRLRRLGAELRIALSFQY